MSQPSPDARLAVDLDAAAVQAMRDALAVVRRYRLAEVEIVVASDGRGVVHVRPWHPGGPGRPPKDRGGAMLPQCKLNDGRMRVEHVYDEDGLCDCGARKPSFEPLPTLRPKVEYAAAPKRATLTPAIVAAPSKPKAKSAPPAKVEKHIGGTTFAALIADLERQRASYDQAIARLREIEEWWPR